MAVIIRSLVWTWTHSVSVHKKIEERGWKGRGKGKKSDEPYKGSPEGQMRSR